MHTGIKTCLDGKFFVAPLDDPQTILDIGLPFGYALHNHLHSASPSICKRGALAHS